MVSLAGCLHPDTPPQGEKFASAPEKKEFFIGQPAKENVEAREEAETEALTEAAKESGKTMLDPKYSDVLSSQAFNLLNSGNYADAKLIFERSLTYNPNNVVAKKGMKKVEELLRGEDETETMQQNKKDAKKLVQLDAGLDDEAAFFLETGLDQVAENEDCQVPEAKRSISDNFFTDIVLSENIPSQYRKGEIKVIKGRLANGKKAESLTIELGSDSGINYFTGSIQDGMFGIPVHFAEAGETSLGMYLGASKKGKTATVEVIDPECEPLVREKTIAPSDLNYSITEGSATFAWDGHSNNLFRLEFVQRQNRAIFYLKDADRFIPPLTAFRAFTEGAAKVKIWAAKADKNSLDRKTMWVPGDELELFLTQHISRNNQAITDFTTTETFAIGDKVEISGSSSTPLAEAFLIVDRKGQLTSGKLNINGNTFSGTFFPRRLGNHVIGIYAANGGSMMIAGIPPKGSVPLIPDYFDLDNSLIHVDFSRIAENLFRYINHERNSEKIAILETSDNLDKLAQARAEDMCENNYLGNESPDGRTAIEEKVRFNITGEIEELFVESNDIRTAHEILMRSPKSQAALLNPDMDSIGFGYCQRESREKTFVIVEILENKKKPSETPAEIDTAKKVSDS